MLLYNLVMFYFDKISGKRVLKSDYLSCLEHFFTTRESVIKTKEPNFKELVNQNRKIFCDYLNTTELIYPSQTHSANVSFAQTGKTIYPETDALILKNKEQAIFLNFADCTPVILYDKKQNIGAISHAGWRGTAQKIVPKTIETMNSNPKDIIAVIGPAIGFCCYNVGVDVYEQLKTTVENFDGLFEIRNGEIFVNLKGINAQQLREAGVENTDICPYCTCCNNDLFFSYRKENGTTNRHSAIIKLKQ